MAFFHLSGKLWVFRMAFTDFVVVWHFGFENMSSSVIFALRTVPHKFPIHVIVQVFSRRKLQLKIVRESGDLLFFGVDYPVCSMNWGLAFLHRQSYFVTFPGDKYHCCLKLRPPSVLMLFQRTPNFAPLLSLRFIVNRSRLISWRLNRMSYCC